MCMRMHHLERRPIVHFGGGGMPQRVVEVVDGRRKVDEVADDRILAPEVERRPVPLPQKVGRATRKGEALPSAQLPRGRREDEDAPRELKPEDFELFLRLAQTVAFILALIALFLPIAFQLYDTIIVQHSQLPD